MLMSAAPVHACTQTCRQKCKEQRAPDIALHPLTKHKRWGDNKRMQDSDAPGTCGPQQCISLAGRAQKQQKRIQQQFQWPTQAGHWRSLIIYTNPVRFDIARSSVGTLRTLFLCSRQYLSLIFCRLCMCVHTNLCFKLSKLCCLRKFVSVLL